MVVALITFALDLMPGSVQDAALATALPQSLWYEIAERVLGD